VYRLCHRRRACPFAVLIVASFSLQSVSHRCRNFVSGLTPTILRLASKALT
jgi:hypothetical protein